MYVKCYTCNKLIKRSPSLIKEKNFCDHSCYSKYKSKLWKKEKNPNWNGGELKLKCLVCGKSFTRKRHGQYEPKFCSRKCYSQYRSIHYIKENHPMWRGVITRTTKPLRSKKKYNDWRKEILERDNHTCQICGETKHLVVHHKIRLYDLYELYRKKHNKVDGLDEFFYDKNNGITLCKSCHKMVHSKSNKKSGSIAGKLTLQTEGMPISSQVSS
jgi:5-methylcytosine-specific restriction endonuclease McrA